MRKKSVAALSQSGPAAALLRLRHSEILWAAIFFPAVCLASLSTIRATTLVAAVVLTITAVCGFRQLRDRITLPLLAVLLFVLACGISTTYAQSGKFALQEFLKVLFSFCAAVTLLTAAPKDSTQGGRWLAAILSGGAALFSLVSIDLLSTHLISTPIISFLKLFSNDYSYLGIVEAGTRMTSLIDKPNVYAGIAGIGVLLGLGLASTEDAGWRKYFHLCCLFVNALGFVLAFSMGASGIIAAAFLLFLLLEQKSRRGGLLVLMAETLLFTLLAVVPISMTSFDAWDGFQPIPLLCTMLGAALLCLTHGSLGRKASEKLASKGNVVLALIGVILLAAVLVGIIAYSLTGAAELAQGSSLRRSVYPEGGNYTVSASFTGTVDVTVTSQNRQDTMMHTSTTLYQGDLANAAFTVPEDSLVVYLNFSATSDALLEQVTLQGGGKDISVPLNYTLLPDFISNRLQGLFANQNAIQRTVFFEDGLKLFSRSPIIGLGMGAYENGLRSVQSFAYDTKYAHNHYIQVLAETGIVGLILFLGTLLTAAFALLRARKQETPHLLLPALGAALVFMAGHAAVEVTFSIYAFLPFAFGLFALISLCTGESLPSRWLSRKARTIVIAVTAVLLSIFSFFLVQNMRAKAMVSDGQVTFNDLIAAASIDKFEWADYALSFVASTPADADPFTLQMADDYAARLSQLNSNSVPRYLIQYYLKTGQITKGLSMAYKYVDFVAVSPDAWQSTFDYLMLYQQNTEEFRAGVLALAQKLEDWNAVNMGTIELDADAQAFIKSMEEGK